MASVTHEYEHTLMLDVQDIEQSAFVVDSNRRIVAWNDAAERLLGLCAQEVMGQHCYDAMRACHLPPCESCVCMRTKAGGQYIATLQGAKEHSDDPAPIMMYTIAARTLRGSLRIAHLLYETDTFAESDTSYRVRDRVVAPSAVFDAPPSPLTMREREVLHHLAEGRSTSEISEVLAISLATARNHVAHVIAKLGARTRLQAVVIAAQQHLI